MANRPVITRVFSTAMVAVTTARMRPPSRCRPTTRWPELCQLTMRKRRQLLVTIYRPRVWPRSLVVDLSLERSRWSVKMRGPMLKEAMKMTCRHHWLIRPCTRKYRILTDWNAKQFTNHLQAAVWLPARLALPRSLHPILATIKTVSILIRDRK